MSVRCLQLLDETIQSCLDKLHALSAACLAQLVKHQSTVREVDGSSPRPDQHSGS